MKTVVLGAFGQLGRDLTTRLPGEVIPLGRDRADISSPDSIRTALGEHLPDVVVNCAAYNFVDQAENEPAAAFAVNAWGVRELARACAESHIRLVHFSTDYVFGLDQDRIIPLTEACPPGPVSVYGLSKLTGEYLVRSICPDHLVIRTCGLYGVWGTGGKGGNFVETMLRVAGQGKPLRVVADQRCTPSYTADVAAATAELAGRAITGVVHLTNSGECSWHDLAAEIFRLEAVEADLTPITSAEFGAPARRPAYSVLSHTRLAQLDMSPMRHWTEALAAYLEERRHRRAT